MFPLYVSKDRYVTILNTICEKNQSAIAFLSTTFLLKVYSLGGVLSHTTDENSPVGPLYILVTLRFKENPVVTLSCKI